jgi:hypothetical protein
MSAVRIRWFVTAAMGAVALVIATLAYDRLSAANETPFAGPASTEPPTFSDRTIAFGLTTPHRQGDERLTGLDETLGSGACAFDYDNDGWVDLFIVNGAGDTRYYGRKHWWQSTGGHRLFKNENGERFADVTQRAGINTITNGMGCVAADFDNDGHCKKIRRFTDEWPRFCMISRHALKRGEAIAN